MYVCTHTCMLYGGVEWLVLLPTEEGRSDKRQLRSVAIQYS